MAHLLSSVLNTTEQFGRIVNTSNVFDDTFNTAHSKQKQSDINEYLYSLANDAKVPVLECTTAAATAAKVVSYEGFTLATGKQVYVKFTNTNTASVSSLTLNVQNTGAKPIKYINNNSANNIPGAGYLTANRVYKFYYDGTNWVSDITYNSTYTVNNGTFSIKSKVGETTTVISDFTANQSDADEFTLVQGSNITLTPSTSDKTLTLAAVNNYLTSVTISGEGNAVTGGSINSNGTTLTLQTNKFLPLSGSVISNGKLSSVTLTGSIGRIYNSASTNPFLYVGSNNQDVTLLRVYSHDVNDADFKSAYGYSLKYLGTGSGAANYLTLYTDNSTNSNQNLGISVNNAGNVGIGVHPSTSTKLLIDGGVQLTGTIVSNGHGLLKSDGTIDTSTYGTGTVTSVGLSLPNLFSVTNSPVTTSGTLTASLAAQSKNTVFAGPSSGNNAAPTFRSLVAADIPSLSWSKITSGKPTTLSGYGITDAKIEGNTITLGSNSATLLSTDHIPLATDTTVGGVLIASTTIAGAPTGYIRYNVGMLEADQSATGVKTGSLYVDTLDTKLSTVTVSGSGNAITTGSISSDGKTLTLTKGSTFLTSHQTVTNSNPTLSWGNTSTIGSVGGTNLQVTMPANPNVDTKNTAGATEDPSKLFLVGAKNHNASPQTYTGTVYTQNGEVYSGSGDKYSTATETIEAIEDTVFFKDNVSKNSYPTIISALLFKCANWGKFITINHVVTTKKAVAITDVFNEIIGVINDWNNMANFDFVYNIYNISGQTIETPPIDLSSIIHTEMYLYGTSNVTPNILAGWTTIRIVGYSGIVNVQFSVNMPSS